MKCAVVFVVMMVLCAGMACAAPKVILKLDDLSQRGAVPGQGVMWSWIKTDKMLERENVKAAIGIIGDSLEEPSEEYIKWIKGRMACRRYVLWNHGYVHKEFEFKGPSKEEQKETLLKTQRLAKEKLGLTLHSFCSPWGNQDTNTVAALNEIPELTGWLFGNAMGLPCPAYVFPRVVNLEYPVMNPNFEKTKAAYESKGRNLEMFVLQGHPNGWDDKRLAEFEKVVQFLKAEGCEFIFPEEWIQSVGAK